jgi:putative DNA primase/helicase
MNAPFNDAWVKCARDVRIETEIERRGIKLRGTVERFGACPKCGGDDRFSINTNKQVWNCRGCEAGGDVINLVRHLDGVDFRAACSTLAGEPPQKRPPTKEVVAEEYRYEYETGESAFVKVRFEYQRSDGSYVTNKDGKRQKSFRQRRPDPDKPDGWIWNVDGIPPLLYRLPEVIEAVANEQIVLIVEGERKANLLWSWNVPATCNSGGAKKWKAEHAAPLAGADVVIIPDNDQPGQDHLNIVARSLEDTAASIRVLKLPGLPPKGDIVDWAAKGGTVEQLIKLIESTSKHWVPAEADPPRGPEHSDDALALEFVSQFGADSRFVAQRGKWFFWNSGRWKLDETLRAFDLARTICRDHAMRCDNSQHLASALASAKTIGAVERLAKTDRHIAATIDLFDTDPFIFNNQTTTVDLRTGVDREPRREDYCTKSSAVTAPSAEACPLWMKFLSRVTKDNAELIGFLQRFLGYCLTGNVREHVLAFLYGTGSNGKSVFVSTAAGILGDYAVVAAMETFIASNVDRHPTEIAKLMGARLVVARETQKGRRWDEAKIKNLTGGDKLTGRFMRGDFFDFEPTHKLLLAGNHKPTLRSVDEAMRRRILLVPFTETIPIEERDLKLEEKLKAEWPSILRWMIDGCLEWQRDGLQVPKIVREATDEYLEDHDTLAQWLEEMVDTDVKDPRAFVPTRELFASWRKWCDSRNFKVSNESAFAESLEDKGFEKVRHRSSSAQQRGFKRMALRQPEFGQG